MSKSTSDSGIGFVGLLAILFIPSKLTGVIDWSWWWVMAAIWGITAAYIVGFFVVCIYLYCAAKMEKRKSRIPKTFLDEGEG